MLRVGGLAVVFVVVFYLIGILIMFWIIRLAVRAGVNDALTKNRSWLSGRLPSSDVPGDLGSPRDATQPPEPGVWDRGEW